MLGKLVFYDGKIQLKFLSSLCIVSVLISLFAGGMGWLCEAYPNVMVFGIFSTLTLGFSILAIIAMIFGNTVYAVIYFRKNIFRDEGYLTHTLPVTKAQLFFSKLITSTVSVYLSILVACLCACIGTRRWDYISIFLDMLEESGVQETGTVVLSVIILIFLIPVTLCQFYASLVLGYTWKVNSGNHINRDLLSFASYIILYMVQQAFALICILVYLVIAIGSPFSSEFVSQMESLVEKQTGDAVMSYIQGVLGIAFGLNVIVAVILITIVLWRLNHNLDLE